MEKGLASQSLVKNHYQAKPIQPRPLFIVFTLRGGPSSKYMMRRLSILATRPLALHAKKAGARTTAKSRLDRDPHVCG